MHRSPPGVSLLGVKTAHPAWPDSLLMTQSNLHMLLARTKIDDFRRQAAKGRLAWESRAGGRERVLSARALVDGSVTLRPCRAEDRARLARLAALDSSATPAAPVLLVEVGGELRAALSLKDGAVVADPFHPTSALAALLREYSRQPSLRAAASTTGHC